MEENRVAGLDEAAGRVLDAVMAGAAETVGHGDGRQRLLGVLGKEQPGGQFDAVGQGNAHVDALNHGGHSFSGSLFMRRDVTAAQV